MPTRRGWLLVLCAVAAGVGGRVLGARELYLISSAGGALIAGAVCYVRGRRIALDVRRILSPQHVQAGDSARVDLAVTNLGRRATPILRLADGSAAPFLVGPLGTRETVQVAYTTRAGRRGLLPVGPLLVYLADPFRIACRLRQTLAASTLTVQPRFEAVSPPPDHSMSSIATVPYHLNLSPTAGGDFHALRPYVEGDDLRRVHWPITAHRDELVVRQDAQPHLRKMTVVLDLRAAVHSSATVEAAVSAAASVAVAGLDESWIVRLVTTGGADSGHAGGGSQRERALNLLAIVDPDRCRDLRDVARELGDCGDETVVLITSTASSADDLDFIARCSGHGRGAITVLFEVSGHAMPLSLGRLSAGWVVPVAPNAPFGASWERALGDAW